MNGQTVVKNGGQKRWSNLEGGVHPLAGGVDDGCHRQREEELEPVPAAVKHTGHILVKTGQILVQSGDPLRRPIAQVPTRSHAHIIGQTLV